MRSYTQLEVLDQHFDGDFDESCGYHAFKNVLLCLLLSSGSIDRSRFEYLLKSDTFYGDICLATKSIAQARNVQTGQDLRHAAIDVTNPVMIDFFKLTQEGKLDLSRHGITSSMLSRLSLTQNGSESWSVGDISLSRLEVYGISGVESDLFAAANVARLVRETGKARHAFLISRGEHWVSVFMEQESPGKRVWQFMDSMNNSSSYAADVIQHIESVLNENEKEIQTYLLQSYDEVNKPDFDVRYRDHFGSNREPKNADTARQYFIDNKEILERFITYVENRFYFMQTVGWLYNSPDKVKRRIHELHTIANYLFQQVGEAEQSRLGRICFILRASLDKTLPRTFTPPSQEQETSSMNIQQINYIVCRYYFERSYGRAAAGMFTFGIYGAPEDIKALSRFMGQVMRRMRGPNNSEELTDSELNGLKQILANRWLHIRGGENSYLSNFDRATNSIYQVIATTLAKKLGVEPCTLLMPTLENDKSPIFQAGFKLSELNQCIMTDDYKFLIPVGEILEQYQRTYELKNPYTNRPFTEGELARMRSNPDFADAFRDIDDRVAHLCDGISPGIIEPLKALISATFEQGDDRRNPPERHIAILQEYIEKLPVIERDALFNAKVTEGKTFIELLRELQPEDMRNQQCSFGLFGHYLIPFLNNIERLSGKNESFLTIKESYAKINR